MKKKHVFPKAVILVVFGTGEQLSHSEVGRILNDYCVMFSESLNLF